ncbi:MAG: helix-turn-helix domain-containing protein [Clostridia bacterium]|nr:helix-turn-helix domain-containing protein [Clostridia bacterium]
MRAPLETKAILNPGEAIELYGMSARRFYRLIRGKRKLPFLALYNKRKLIIRAEFEKYLEEHPEEKEQLKKCQRTNKEDAIPSEEFCEVAKVSVLTENTSSNTW